MLLINVTPAALRCMFSTAARGGKLKYARACFLVARFMCRYRHMQQVA